MSAVSRVRLRTGKRVRSGVVSAEQVKGQGRRGDVFFRTIFLFFIIELGTCRIGQAGVTRCPRDPWVAQELREATPFGDRPRFLICDNDAKYSLEFARVVTGAGIRLLHTTIAAPKANAICERLLGSVRRDCLAHLILFGERHLRRLTTQYVAYYNHARPHQGLNQRIPAPMPTLEYPVQASHRIESAPVLGGLHHDYRRAA
jgi:putative transposase